MSSFAELNSVIENKRNDHNGYIRRDHQENHHHRQQRISKRLLKKSFERQLSDKHLKRRAQIVQAGGIDNINSRGLYQYHHASSSPALSQGFDSSQQYQYESNRRPDRGAFFFLRNKKRSILKIMLPLIVILIILLITMPTIWHTILVKVLPAKIAGGENHNRENDAIGNDDTSRSYQDLADSIKRLRIRRQALKEESQGERQGEQRLTNDNAIDYRSNYRDEDEIRLKRLEQKIQREQSEKIRKEFSSSNINNQDDQTDGNIKDADPNPAIGTDATALKYKVMSENIAALQEFNEKNGNNID